MSVSTVLVFGSPRLHGDVNAKQALCRKLGAAIVSHPALRLLTGGARGDEATGGGVDLHVLMGAATRLSGPERCREKVLTVLAGRDAAVAAFGGEVVVDDAPDEAGRRRRLVSVADVVVTIEGGPGTTEVLRLAREQERPVLALCGTGGASDEWDASSVVWTPADTDSVVQRCVAWLEIQATRAGIKQDA